MPLCDRGSGFGDSHFGLDFNVFVEPELSATFSRACSTFNGEIYDNICLTYFIML